MSRSNSKPKAAKSSLGIVPKVWGKEIWIVNEKEYCAKFLVLRKGAQCSYHYHPKKKETFYALRGEAILTLEGEDYILNTFSPPRTILPKQKHSFLGLKDSVLLEVSTHHEDDDVIRLSNSKP